MFRTTNQLEIHMANVPPVSMSGKNEKKPESKTSNCSAIL